ncbi:hypothetical protein JXA32_15815 [Candidatus Sumerlaeota bacterium]|nr:hypothetical protein [Candidatus Sumerlaeota bacterium]
MATAKKAAAKKSAPNPGDAPPASKPAGTSEQADPSAPASKPFTQADVVQAIFGAYLEPDAPHSKKADANIAVQRYLEQTIAKHSVGSQYNIILFYDTTRMVQSDADNIYSAVTEFPEEKPILVILHSTGGYVEPAYLIGKLLREYSGEDLHIAVPRRAKSAATLLCCAADRIHMGGLSELGPIDPQIDNLPALGLKSSVQHIAELVAEYPQATELFSNYLAKAVKPIHIGYYERVAESAVQYAERLLKPHAKDLKDNPENIAKTLVYSYKDHGFVIDKQEAVSIFGDKLVVLNTPEYNLGNALYQALDFINRIAGYANQTFYMIGSLTTAPVFTAKK